LAIICVSTTDDVRQILDTVGPERLVGRTLLNVTSGTPDDARSLRDWAQTHGIGYLDASIAAYPEQLGTEEARILVAGDEGLWDAHRDAVLDLAGSSMYVGGEYGAANALDCAVVGAFYISSLTAFIEAARFVNRFGVSLDVLASLTDYAVSVLGYQAKQALDRIAADDFSTDQATLNVYADAAAAFAAGLEEHGDAPIIRATAQTLRRGVDAGLGKQDIAAMVTIPS
jgi:3-hydroxyisobutyrate dehydrogenase-like beta-hydroxyacid dehydrogenase